MSSSTLNLAFIALGKLTTQAFIHKVNNPVSQVFYANIADYIIGKCIH